MRFDETALKQLTELSELRKKEWVSTDRWNQWAELTGLLGELSYQRLLDLSPKEASDSYFNSLKGDAGFDIQLLAETVDVKSTMGERLKFKFSRTNHNRGRSSIIAFCYVEYTGNEAWCHLLGFGFYHKLVPFIRESENARIVRFLTLQREGVIHPAQNLLVMNQKESHHE
ncbi:MAG: hypothetical protein K2X66_18575 [Cyanobacteria bacterium]|nr:hypothetical protein [Cyanobacteriota bacterium]